MEQGFAYSNLKSVVNNQHESQNTVQLTKLYTTDVISEDMYPLKFKIIHQEQHKDTSLLKRRAQLPNKYTVNSFHGAEKYVN